MAMIRNSAPIWRPKQYSLKAFEDTHQLAYGTNVTIKPQGWVNYDNLTHANWGSALLLGAWEFDSVVQWVVNGSVVDPTKYELVRTGENSVDSTKFDYLPTVSLLSFSASLLSLADGGTYKDFIEQSFITVCGIKHYAYDANGDVLASGDLSAQGGNDPDTTGDGDGKACGHKMNGSSPAVVTNPAWVLAHVFMNEYGVPHSAIDWAAFKDIADWLENPTWSTANPNNGHDIDITLKTPKKLEDVVKMIVPPSVYFRISAGKLSLGRRYETGNSKHSVALHFTDDTIIQDSFSVRKADPYAVPTKFAVTYIKKSLDNQGRYMRSELQTDLEHPFAKSHYGKKQAVKLDISHLSDPDDFESVNGESVPMLEALLAARREIYGTDSFSFETGDLRAMFLEYGDAITFTTEFNTQTFTNQQATVRSIELNEGKGLSVTIHADIHDDDWFLPDPQARITTSLSITTTGPQDYPEFRFKTDPATPTGTISTFKIAPRSGSVLDARAIKPGMIAWQFYSSWLTPPTENWWADPAVWRLLGYVESFDASTNEITLTGASTQAVNANWLVQITPQVSALSSMKMGRIGGRSGLWQVQYYFAKPDWLWMGDTHIETCEGEGSYYETASNWSKWAGSSELITEDGVQAYRGADVMPIEISEDGYVTSQSAAFGGGTMFPLSMRFRKQNRFGDAPSSEQYVYAWPVSLPVSKSFSAISLNAQTNYDLDDNTGSDWTETFGVSLQTNYDESSHGAHVEFVIKWSASPINSGNFEAAATFYDGVPKKTINDPEPVKSALGAVLYFALKTRAPGGDYTQTSSVDNLETIALTKRSRMWRKYSGTINEYNGAGGDLRGAGILFCTHEWENYATNWNNNDPATAAGSDLFAGGLYMYKPHRPAASADVDLWRRWSYRTNASPYWHMNGPTHAFEASGDFKLGHHVYSDTAHVLAHSNEQGIFGFSLGGDQTFKGEYLFGAGKRSANLIRAQESSGITFGPSSISNFSGTNENRGSAVAITRSGSATDRIAGLDVVINGGILPGFLLSDYTSVGGGYPVKTYDSYRARYFFVTRGDRVGSPGNNFQPMLMSYCNAGSIGPNYHTYTYTDGMLGDIIMDNLQQYSGSTPRGLFMSGHYIRVKARLGGVSVDDVSSETVGDLVYRYLQASPYNHLSMAPVNFLSSPSQGFETSTNCTWYFYKQGTTYQLKAYLNGAWRSVTLT